MSIIRESAVKRSNIQPASPPSCLLFFPSLLSLYPSRAGNALLLSIPDKLKQRFPTTDRYDDEDEDARNFLPFRRQVGGSIAGKGNFVVVVGRERGVARNCPDRMGWKELFDSNLAGYDEIVSRVEDPYALVTASSFQEEKETTTLFQLFRERLIAKEGVVGA